MEVHDILTVYYDPENPSIVRTSDYTGGSEQYSIFSLICIVSGAGVAVVSCITDRKENNIAFSSASAAEDEKGGEPSAHDFR